MLEERGPAEAASDFTQFHIDPEIRTSPETEEVTSESRHVDYFQAQISVLHQAEILIQTRLMRCDCRLL